VAEKSKIEVKERRSDEREIIPARELIKRCASTDAIGTLRSGSNWNRWGFFFFWGKISIDPAVTVSAKDVGKEIGHLEASFIIITHNTAIEYPRSQLNFQNGFNGGLLCVGS
jgi:hypothetical protein